MTKRILVAGGTGLIGTALALEAKAAGWDVSILSRSPGPGHIVWSPSKGTIDLQSPMAFDAIINLAGSSIAGKRWSGERKDDIRSSRLQAAGTLETYLVSGALQTSVYIGMSGVSIYGDRDDQLLDDESEISPAGDWLTDTTRMWEGSHQRIGDLGIRTVILRTGIVLSREGGALKEILQTAPFGFIASFGAGRQYWSWIHIRDVVNIILESVRHSDMSGIYLTCAPQPVTVKVLAQTIARHMRPARWVIPVPEFALRIILGEMSRVLIESCQGYPARLLAQGIIFRYPDVDAAVLACLRR